MTEVSVKELPIEIHDGPNEIPNFLEIKSTESMTLEECNDFWDEYFDNIISEKSLNKDCETDNSVDNSGDEIKKLKCINEDLAGMRHPVTGVPFVRRQIEVEGQIIEVTVPEFESTFDAYLPDNMLKSTDNIQINECNRQLKDAVHSDETLRNKFTPEQIEQIEDGETPDGYTWHHDAETGKMQLVDSDTHQRTAHTGGRSIWGGGTEHR